MRHTPPSRRDIIGSVWVAVILTCITSCFILSGSELVALWGLDRRRLNAWEAEWRTTGPLWSGHLS